MSLEQAIQENTAAIRELIAALGAAPVQPLTSDQHLEQAAEHVSKANELERDRLDALELEARESNAKAAEACSKPDAEPAAEAPAVTEDDCKQITLQLASKKGRDAAVAVLSEFGVAKASELKADQLAEYHAAASAALGV